MRFLTYLIAAILLLVAPGRSEPASDTQSKTPKKTATPQPASASYKLAANDIVRIEVFGEEDMTTQARIDKEGAINMNLIGFVKISRQTVREAAKTIETQLREYYKNPQVIVTILGYSKRRFTILGQINRPGIYDLPDETTLNLLEAIGMAGGFTRIAAPDKIILKRTVDGRETTQKLNAKSMGDKEAIERFIVAPGDTINVGERLF